MAMKSAPTDHVVPDHLSFPRLDALALTSDDVKDTAQPTIKQVVGPDGRMLAGPQTLGFGPSSPLRELRRLRRR